jgi:hypothetical protein
MRGIFILKEEQIEMFDKVKKIIIGFFGGVICVFAFILGRKLHNNGNGIDSARDKLKDASSGLDTVSDGLKEVSGRIEHSKDTVADCLGIIEKVRKRKQ